MLKNKTQRETGKGIIGHHSAISHTTYRLWFLLFRFSIMLFYFYRNPSSYLLISPTGLALPPLPPSHMAGLCG